MKEKRSWYVWLSGLGLIYLLLNAWEALGFREAEGKGWMSYLGWAVYLFAGQFLLPGAVAFGFWQRIPWNSSGSCLFGLVLVGFLAYGAGVLAAVRLDRTIRTNQK